MNIIVYDGFCNLCDFSVRQILKYDKHMNFKFASFQNPFTQNLLKALNYENDANQSVLLIQNNEIFEKSDAFVEICKLLDGFPHYFVIIKIIPRFIRDPLYTMISKSRYFFFGRKKTCSLPAGNFNDRFISF